MSQERLWVGVGLLGSDCVGSGRGLDGSAAGSGALETVGRAGAAVVRVLPGKGGALGAGQRWRAGA